jgi:multicomponent Na+:H+ antiporter subunit E
MILVLLLFWIILSGQISLFFIIGAFISIATTIWLYWKIFAIFSFRANLNWRWLIFANKLLQEMFISTAIVMKIIWLNPKNIKPTYSWIRSKAKEPVIYANAITLTPGTMSMLLEGDKIFIHALSADMIDNSENSKLESLVLNLEQHR